MTRTTPLAAALFAVTVVTLVGTRAPAQTPPEAPVAPVAPAPLAPAPPVAPAPPAPPAVPAGVGRVTGTVAVFKDSLDGKRKPDASGVIIYLEAPMDLELEDRLAEDPPPMHEIRQINKMFVPAVSAVIRGTEVGFPNDDMIFHNVFSLSTAKRFDLGLYKSGSTKSVMLTRPGIIDVYCNIHPEMAAKILVLDNPYFAKSAADGSFTIDGVPPGTYPYVAWQARGEPTRGTVTVQGGAAVRLDPVLVETPQSTTHTRKDGTPYGRYN